MSTRRSDLVSLRLLTRFRGDTKYIQLCLRKIVALVDLKRLRPNIFKALFNSNDEDGDDTDDDIDVKQHKLEIMFT